MSKNLTQVVTTGLVSLLILAGKPGEAAETPVDFAHQVAPILQKHCAECHMGRRAEGDFSLNTRQQIIDSGVVGPASNASNHPPDSGLIERVTSDDPDLQMPPSDRPRLSSDEVATLRQWVAADLPWEAGVTFAPSDYEPPLGPRVPELPPGIEGRDHPIDRIVDAYLGAHNVPRPASLEDAEFLRRASLDLVGLLPTPDLVASFCADPSLDKRERAIDAFLADREAYATHWLTFWNDLLRNTYAGTGFIDGGRKQITGWLYRSLYENKPYDQLVRELIAPTPESEGFVRGIVWRGRVNASQTPQLQFSQNVSQVFLGINMKCASCHDSFIDRWTLDQAYGLAAVYATEPMEIHRCDIPQGRMATAAWPFPELGQIDPQAPQPQRLEQLAQLLTSDQNGRFARTLVNRLWQLLMGRGIVHPVDAMQTEPWSADLLDFLASHLVDSNYDMQATLKLIASSHAYQSRVVPRLERPNDQEYVYQGPQAKRMTAEQLLDALWQITGESPRPDAVAFKDDGRSQRGELAAILKVVAPDAPKDQEQLVALFADPESRPITLRAALTPQDALQRSLGRPGREQTVTSRPSELATLEAMTLANGAQLAEILEQGGAALAERHAGAADQLVDALFQAALSRAPTSTERDAARDILGEACSPAQAADFLWCVMMLPEFQLIR